MEAEKSSELLEIFNELKLKHWSQAFSRDLEQMAEGEKKAILKYLFKWGRQEKAERKTAQIASKIRTAKFGKIQTVDSYNFKHNKMTEGMEKNYLSLIRGISRESLPSAVFSGSAGVGKTHLARSVGHVACQKGLSVLFVTAAQMVNHLTHAQKIANLEVELNRYRRPHVLIIDELGYVSLDTQGSNLFFQVISSRHDAELGTIATTNIPFGKFNQIFANDAIAHAIVDRLVNDAEVFFMESDSYRPKQRQEKIGRRKQNV
jgi:DNA replication protein DnaC